LGLCSEVSLVTVQVSEPLHCRYAWDGVCWVLVHLAITFQLHIYVCAYVLSTKYETNHGLWAAHLISPTFRQH
jgi:hypothetical protein